MNPQELSTYLDGLIRHSVQISTMIWGPPGIGKSSIVAQTAARHNLGFIDLRLSQLAVELPELDTLEMNPVLVRPAGHGVAVLDARGKLLA